MPPVIECPFCADQCWSMVALVLASVLTQAYDQMPGLEKMCSNFLYYPNKIMFLCAVMGVRKKQ